MEERLVLCHDFSDQRQAIIMCNFANYEGRRDGGVSRQGSGQINYLIENGSRPTIALSAVSGSRMRPF